jgi:hypothetical protein
MKTNYVKFCWLSGLALGASFLLGGQPAAAADPLKALIVDGQNNHVWRVTTPILKTMLESSGRFTVDVATSPPERRSAGRRSGGEPADAATNATPQPTMADFKPEFSKYGVVIVNLSGLGGI